MSVPHWNGKKWVLEIYKGDKRIKSFTSTNKQNGDKLCMKSYRKWLSEGERGVSDTRLDTLWVLYCKAAKKTYSESALINIKSIYTNHISILGSKRLEDVTLQMFQNILDDAYDKELSRKTIINIRGTITAFLRFMRRSGYETPDPADLTIPKNARLKKGKEILMPEHIKKLLSKEMDNEPSVNFYRFCLATGLRPGEALGLTWGCVHGDVITITQAINARSEITNGKNQNALRTIVISDYAVEILEKQRNVTAELESDWVFGYEGKEMPRQRTLYCRWHGWDKGNGRHLPGLSEKIGCPGTSLYSFRHTYVARAQGKGTDLRSLQQLLGHTENMQTYETYGHVTDELRGTMKKVSKKAFEDFYE